MVYLNREMSLLEFNRRVLELASDAAVPLLERVRYLNIFASNLDEVFMKRVGGLQRQVAAKVGPSNAEDPPPEEQLRMIREHVIPLIQIQSDVFLKEIRPELAKQNIHLLSWEQLNEEELNFLARMFYKSVFPVLTPLAVDPGHPFPHISNLSTSFGVLMKNPDKDGEELFARIKIPPVFPTWIRVNSGNEIRLISLYEFVGRNLDALFPGMKILDVMMFRVTRNADVEKDDEDTEDLLETVAEELRERRFAQVVRLEHGPRPNQKILSILREELKITADHIYELPEWLEYFALQAIPELNRPDLKFPTWVPSVPTLFADQDANVFDIIRAGDVLVHHPYESFSGSVERFIRAAVDDPKVIAIKMTLYRTGEDSPFIPLLIRAAEAGKQVACLVELKARMDEEKNIQVAQALEKAGVHVVYGILGLKTHCKISLVVRQEVDQVRCYVHVGTGNYHSRTARLYTDLGLFTANEDFTDDVVHLFHYLTGRSLRWNFKKIIVAPIDMETKFLQMIERETEIAKKGGPGYIIAKMNSLEHLDIINALYKASAAGVNIDLIVRGVCCLRPQVAGLSENIRVISILGRFLEHSRIFYFRNSAEEASDGEIYIGSADWMYRNLNARVEAVVPVEENALRLRCWEILQIMLHDERQVWDMSCEGAYQRRRGAAGEGEGAQEKLMRLTKARDLVR